MMYAFVIALHIILPDNETHDFRIYSQERSGQMFCPDRAKAATDRYVDYVKRRLPLAEISVEITCEPTPTRFI